MTTTSRPPVPLLFLVGDNGGGHRSAANAVAQALDRLWPDRFAPVIYDPLLGQDAPRRLRWFVGIYGPMIRWCPWLWGVLWHAYGRPATLGWLWRTFLAPAYTTVGRAVAACQPAVIVAFHPMTTQPAARARDCAGGPLPVITVITDLITAHLAWRNPAADHVIAPSAAMAGSLQRQGLPEERVSQIGLPVAAEFCRAPLRPPQRRALRRSLGQRGRFLVVVTGGGEGSGGMYRRTAAILKRVEGVDVAVICGRNRLLARRLARLAARTPGARLTVHGYVDNMADWLRGADIVVGKAGPGTIAEALCCGTPLILTSRVPGQEEGNAEFVVTAGAGSYAPRPRQLAAEVARLRRDPAALARMRAAAAQAGRPHAAADIAHLIAGVASDTIPVEYAFRADVELAKLNACR
jgi:1,2-diacylglycerol 3-beta-galactosyltransferase